MEIYRKPGNAQASIKKIKFQGKTIGFVPTMGYLHEGHLSLVKRARQENDVVVVSIFVNPKQFGPGEDFEKYPREEERDLKLLEDENVDIVFTPDKEDMYPDKSITIVSTPNLQNKLCGKSRPGHFDGVTTVVAKLFNIVMPHRAYFGQKDYQQYLIIKKMVSDLNFGLNVIACPIVREADGLAMSSRNKYLSERERREAVNICKGLKLVEDQIKAGAIDKEKIKSGYQKYIDSHIKNSRLDYIEILDAADLEEIRLFSEKALVATAVFVGKTRLIDNIIVSLG